MRLVVTIYILLSGFQSMSQIQTKPILPDNMIKLKLKKETGPKLHFDIHEVIIIDGRNDTSSIGYSTGNPVKKYCFKNSITNELHDWFYEYLNISKNDTSSLSLLINIKKLRVSEEVMPKISHYGKFSQPQSGFDAGVIIKLEYYLQKNDSYFPLYRFDSIIPLRGTLEKYAATFISIALRSSLVMLDSINPEKALILVNNITSGDIERVNRQSCNFLLYNDSIYPKGIYKTFNDFKNNVVSIKDFEFKNGQLGDIIYIKEDGNEYPLRKIWGFSDGKDLYINSSDKYSKLIRVGNTFYFEGIKKLATDISYDFGSMMVSAVGRVYGANVPSQGKIKYTLSTKYYQVDMENGEVF